MPARGMAARAPDEHSETSPSRRGRSPSIIPVTPFGKYTLVARLGRGGMAEVFLGFASGPAGFRKPLVIKRILADLQSDDRLVDMFFDEARLAARLHHPHVVQTYEVGRIDGVHFLAMEYLEGQPLHRILRRCSHRKTNMPAAIAARIAVDALDGLQYAHDLKDFDGTPLGVVHRDISPQNVFVTYDGVVKVLDFGIAKSLTQVVQTRTGAIKGKYAYMAPEQAKGTDVDPRADVWAMGVVLFESVTGQRLFKGETDLATLQASLKAPIPRLADVMPGASPLLGRVIERALTRDLDRRYASAEAMKEDLEHFIRAQPAPVGRQELSKYLRKAFGDVIEEHRQLLSACMQARDVSSPSIEAPPPRSSSSGVLASTVTGSASSAPPPPSTPSSSGSAPIGDPPRAGTGTPSSMSAGGEEFEDALTPVSEQSQRSHVTGSRTLRSKSLGEVAAMRGRPLMPWLVLSALVLACGVAGAAAAILLPGSGDGEAVADRRGESPGTVGEPPSLEGTETGATVSGTAEEATGAGAAGDEAPTGDATEGDAESGAGAETGDAEDTGGSAEAEGAAETGQAGPTTARERLLEARRRERWLEARREREAAEESQDTSTDTGQEDETAASGTGETGAAETQAAAQTGSGHLTLDTVPWSEVVLGGRVLGTTPLIGVELPAGTHTLVLRNPEQGIETRYRVRIEAGSTTTRRLGLQ